MEENNDRKEQDEALAAMDYPATEDIFNQEDHITLDGDGNPAGSDAATSTMSMDLDVPGSDLDNAQEEIGSEDEENNYYSIGGDNHNDLEQSDDN